jgi:NADPH2:quinone reductase
MTQDTMIAAFYERCGPPHDVLTIGEVPTPQPAAGEVLVRIAVSGVNPHDTKKRAGWRGHALSTPRVIPHADGAGAIAAVGPGVPETRVGERVWIVRADTVRPGSGAAAEFAIVPSEHAYPLPAGVEPAIGACLGVPGMTAHRAVFADGVVTGQTILVTGGAGAVASYAIQLARWNGARVIATVSSPEKADHVRKLGADEVVDYRRADVAQEVLRLTDGAGVDRVVEVDFGANAAACHRVIKPNGVIAAYSSTRVPEPTFDYYAFALRGVTLRLVQGMVLPAAARREAARDLNALVARGLLQHTIARIEPLAKIADAHAALEAGVIGKVLVSSP